MKKLSTDQIREEWLKFFKEKQHFILQPASLIPKNDPSLLWINSGVATLKKYFSGLENPPLNRLANCQKVIRTNDILNVGITSRHHTFFEMLGNFSIGDYFKKEAIEFAFELLIKRFEINKDKLFITVYEKDDECFNQWISLGINKSHIIKGNKDRNFWDIGQGPCGPCTEIFYDRGQKYDPLNKGFELFKNDIENDRYIEIWNIVFSQFENDGKCNYSELVRKNIDTGAGLERLASISQDVPTDFDTDNFQRQITKLEDFSQFKYQIDAYFKNDIKQKKINYYFRVIVDHIKAAVFAINDGAMPSGKDRGYIIRKLIRRGMIFSRKLMIKENFIEPLVSVIIETMKSYYDNLEKNRKKIIDILIEEENQFNKTLDIGFKLFNENIKNKKLSGEIAFKLLDTYGFPLEIIEELCEESKISFDKNEFDKKYEEHQKKSKAKIINSGMQKQNKDLLNFKKISKFDYDNLSIKNVLIIGMFDENFNEIRNTNNKCWLVFDKTCFYATSGGQQHDKGIIKIKNNNYEVLDVIKGPNRQHFHLINNNKSISINDKCDLLVDKDYRKQMCRSHTAEHLLHKALKEIISDDIKQEGSSKHADKFTFDFNYHRKFDDEEITKIENKVNEYINKNIACKTLLCQLDEAKAMGALAYFENVYSKIKGKLRVVKFDDLSCELCGGTHVNNTKDIEQFLITKYVSKGSGSWRIEAITSNKKIQDFLTIWMKEIQLEYEKIIKEAKLLGIDTKKLEDIKFNHELTKNNLQNSYQKLQLAKNVFNKLKSEHNTKNVENIENEILNKISNNTNLVYYVFNNVDRNIINNVLKKISNLFKDKLIFLLNKTNGGIQYLISSKANKFNIPKIINEINKKFNSSGGGKENFGQGMIQVAKIETIISFVESKLGEINE